MSLLSAEKFAKKAAAKYGGEPIVYTVKPGVPYYNINTNEYISDRAKILAVKEIIMTKPIKKSLPKSRDHFFCIFDYLSIPKRFLNLSTRPPVSTSFCLPV